MHEWPRQVLEQVCVMKPSASLLGGSCSFARASSGSEVERSDWSAAGVDLGGAVREEWLSHVPFVVLGQEVSVLGCPDQRLRVGDSS